MGSFDVYGIGNALVDMEFKVEDDYLKSQSIEKGLMTLVDSDRQEELINSVNHLPVKRQCGGSAANSLFAMAQLGGSGFYTCKVADDNNGEFYITELKKAGLETNYHLDNRPEGVTGKCMVMVTPDAQRTMCTFLGITSTLSEQEVRLEQLDKSKYLYIEGYLVASPTGFQAAMKCLKHAKAHGIKTALTFSDPSMVEIFRENFEAFLNEGIDLLFCNEDEAKKYTGKDNLEDAFEDLKEVSKQFVVTVGVDGARVYDGDNFINIPSFPTDVVDTNGAGDMFAGAFLFAITSGFTFKHAGILASMAASKIVSQFGPRLEADQMIEILKDFKEEHY